MKSDQSTDTNNILPCGRVLSTRVGDFDGDLTVRNFSEDLPVFRERLNHYVEQHRMKQSQQRWTIAKLVLTSNKHMSAQEIVRSVQILDSSIGTATVYRNLKILTDAKVLREALIDNIGTIYYEPFIEDHHDHVVCVDCGQIFEFHNKDLENIQNNILREDSFKPIGHQHVLYAHCQI